MNTIPYARRLLTNVDTIVAPEVELLGAYFLRLNALLKRHGLAMAVDDDMSAFDRVCRETGKFMPNVFNPAALPIGPRQAIWMSVEDRAGQRVATFAARLFELGARSLGDWLSTLSLFYGQPIRDMPSGERLVLGEEADGYATSVRGRCTYIGGLWLAPAWRGRTALAELVTTAGCALALSRWDAAPMISIAEDEVYAKNAAKYRFDEAHGGVRWLRPHKPERSRMWLLGRTRRAVVDDVRDFVDAPEAVPLVVEASARQSLG
jgi:hypothetical protein